MFESDGLIGARWRGQDLPNYLEQVQIQLWRAHARALNWYSEAFEQQVIDQEKMWRRQHSPEAVSYVQETEFEQEKPIAEWVPAVA